MLLVFKDDSTRVLNVNDSFARMWEAASLLGEFSCSDLAESMLAIYELSAEVAAIKAGELIDLWKKEGLILP